MIEHKSEYSLRCQSRSVGKQFIDTSEMTEISTYRQPLLSETSSLPLYNATLLKLTTSELRRLSERLSELSGAVLRPTISSLIKQFFKVTYARWFTAGKDFLCVLACFSQLQTVAFLCNLSLLPL